MTAQDILDRLLALFPDFGPVWDGEDNYFRDDDGSFTRCGVFAEFSHFFRDRYEHFTEEQRSELGAFVSECADPADADLRDAVASCFLENVASERFSADFQRHLSGEALRLYLV